MKKVFRSSFAFILLGLLLIKISSFHIYDHQDSSIDPMAHCELCLQAIEGQQMEMLYPPFVADQVISTPILFERKAIFPGPVLSNTATPAILFSRPPPSPIARG
ncbi:hypothetical protein [Poritiphilus flavus]|uniref:Uncharacterized protein n=1 Tax=Poritiphilus flavus TaxID=2697053 RepID=A0A6L9E7H5_9FLAO|nr:hypothetical protein [Poritiphilus flavus]NAS10640.1 hypothetical protein [Poritiphilus flavus]